MFDPSAVARVAVPLLVLAVACAQPAEIGAPIEIRQLAADGEPSPIDHPLAVGGRIELVIHEPDPDEPGYVRQALVAGYRVEPADAVVVSMQPTRRNLVVRALAEGSITFRIETDEGNAGELTLDVQRPARVDVALANATGAWSAIPEQLGHRSVKLLPGGMVGLDPRVFDAGGRPLLGYDVIGWSSTPEGRVELTRRLGRSDQVEVRSEDGEGIVTLRATPTASSAAALAVDVPLTVERTHPDSLHLVAVGRRSGSEAVSLDAERPAMTIDVGVPERIEIFALDDRGDVLLTGAPVEARIVGGGEGWNLSTFFAPNVVVVAAPRPGPATVELRYLGRNARLELSARRAEE